MLKKILLSSLLFLAAGLSVSAQTQRVTLQSGEMTLGELLREVESQTGLSIMYDSKLIDVDRKVSVNYNNAVVSKVFYEVLGTGVKVSFQGDIAVISESQKATAATASKASATKEVRGTVVDAKSKEPMMFVSVFVPGTTNGTVTDTNGRFNISLGSGEDKLQFGLLGYQDQVLEISASNPNLTVEMKESTEFLESAVVTALGITRDEKSIGYAVSKLDSDDINSSISNNWVNGMDGKVAGLSFEQASTGPGGSVRVTLRGENSLSHDKNEALFVIDGVPMLSGMTASSNGSGYGDTDAPIDYGNGIGDINPEDIESVTVLKGPAATALYGSQAANGAIVITTKSGRDTDRAFRVDFASSTIVERAGFFPDFQTEYGSGNGNASNRLGQSHFSFWNVPAEMSDDGVAVSRNYSRIAFGPRYEGQMFYNYNSANWKCEDGIWSIDSYTRTPWEATDWYEGAFKTGATTSNTVAISYNPGKDTSIRFSLSDKRNWWILPNTGYTTQNFTLSLNQNAGRKIKLGAKVTYYRKDSDNLPSTGYSTASPMYALMHNLNSVSVKDMREEYTSGRMLYFLRQRDEVDTNVQTNLINYQSDNLFMILNEHTNSMDRDRVFGNANITFLFNDHLNLLVRSGIDLASDFRTQRKSTYSTAYKNGFYKEQTIREFLNTDDVLLSYNNRWGDWDLKATLGGSVQINNFGNVQVTAKRLDEPNVFILQNSLDQLVVSATRRNKKIYSAFGTASLSYKDMVFLDITGRNDWSSTLPRGNRSYFYPSISTGILINKLAKLPAAIDLLKVRASWANVGNDTTPYNTEFTYSNSVFPSSYVIPSTLQNRNLKPENVESWEAGVQFAAFKKRISFDAAFYKTTTTNQIIPVPSDYITGAAAHYINAGMVTNTGIEFSLGGTPVSTKNFTWDLNFTISRNWNKLVELADGVDVWQLNSNTVGSRVYIYAFPGTELGRIYGQGYKRAPEGAYYIDANGAKQDCSGKIVVDPENGNPILNGTTPDDLFDFGSIYPDWKGGLTSNFRYKSFSLSMLFTYQIGGKAYSITHFGLSSQGKLKNSLEGRYDGLLVDGVIMNEDGTYSPNTTVVTDIVDYYTTYKYSRNNVEENVFGTSFLKFKELKLDYNVPAKTLQNIKWLSRVAVGVYATNIFCLTEFPIYDPEVATLTGASISRGIEACAYPMTRSYGLNLKLTF